MTSENYISLQEKENENYVLQSAPKGDRHWSLQKRLFDMIPEDAGTILEIGVGDGYWLHHISSSVKCYGVDIVEKFVRAASQRYPLKLAVMDGQRLGFQDDAFDMVLADNVLEHFSDPAGGLREIWRVLRHGCRLLAAMPLDGRNPGANGCPSHMWKVADEEQIRDALKEAGFWRIEITMVDGLESFGVQHDPSDNMLVLISAEKKGDTLSRLRRRMRDAGKNGERVAVCGGGEHTAKLFRKKRLFDQAQITGVFDRSPRKPEPGWDFTPRPTWELFRDPPDLVVVSSHRYQDEIASAIRPFLPEKVEIYSMYEPGELEMDVPKPSRRKSRSRTGSLMKDVTKVIVISIPKTGTGLISGLVENLGYTKKIVEEATTGDVKGLGEGEFLLTHMMRMNKCREILSMLESGEAKIIFNYRDPRAAVVSQVNYVCDERFGGLHNSASARTAVAVLTAIPRLEDRVKYLLSSGWEPRTYFLEMGYLRLNPKVLDVRYEDLVGPGGGGSRAKQVETVSKVMEYIGAEGDPEEVAESLYNEKSTTFFKGNSEAWRDVFDDELNELIKTTYPGVFDIYGYE